MSRTLAVRLFGGALLLLGARKAVHDAQTPAPPQLTMNQVKDDLYEIVGDGGNVAVYITNEGVILIDDKFEQDYDQIMAKVKSVTNQPIKYILSTHHHADHSGGNVKFASAVQIISTANARANIVDKKCAGAPATMTNGECRVHRRNRRVFGRKRGARSLLRPRAYQWRCGDLFPAAEDSPHRRSDVWSQFADRLSGRRERSQMDQDARPGAGSLDFDTVIPGHGNVTNKAGLLTYRNNVEKLRNRATGLIREGKSQDEVGKG